jgi:hypothetical protein
MLDNTNPEIMKAHAHAQRMVASQMAAFGNEGIPRFLTAMAAMKEGHVMGMDLNPVLKSFETGELARMNAVSRAFRRNSRAKQFSSWSAGMAPEMVKSISKSTLDVGSLTNLANVTGGQALGLVSMDTRMARGTVRPKSFTLYNALNKTMAGQIVDYWAYASDTGGGLPGTVFQSYSSQSTGSLSPNSGSYNLKFLNLKLAVDPRAITMALAQQNSFVNVAEQESTNAALNILSSIDWSLYWGTPALWPNQPQGIYGLIPAGNIVDWWTYYNSAPVQAAGISHQQALFNLIYQQTGFITSWRQFGQITHAFMTPATIGDLQSLVTSGLRNIVEDLTSFERTGSRAIVVNGELVGMNTRFGDIQFPIDFFITARDVPAQAQLHETDNTDFTLAAIPAPTSITASVNASGSGTSAGSEFYGAFTPVGGGTYYYAAVSTDGFMNESAMTFTGSAATVLANDSVTLTIAPGTGSVAAGVAAFRVFRSGLGFAGQVGTWTNATNPNGSFPNPAAFRVIGAVAANGSSSVTFVDLNKHIPGSEVVFLLDLDEEDDALDYRTMLPLTKIELFANNLYMPWAVASIGAPRMRVPKFHGVIQNYLVENPDWDPLASNASAVALI